MADLPIAAVVRIAKKNGAERVGSDAAAALVAKAEDYIANLTKEANRLALHAGRKTIKEEDVDLAAKSSFPFEKRQTNKTAAIRFKVAFNSFIRPFATVRHESFY
jgi:histone H3/H4